MYNLTKPLLKPKYDVVFQALFGENKENITQSFVSDILGEKIEIVDIKTDSTLLRKYPTEKGGRLDLKTKFNDGTICQIEMQLLDEKNIIDRVLYYWSKTFSSQLKRGEPFKKLAKTIGIVITDFELEEMKGIEDLAAKWQIKCNKNDKRILTDNLELRIIEIPKAARIIEKNKYDRIAQWLMFLDNPNTERVEEIMKENEEVKKAKSVLHEMSEDEELERLAELRERWEHEEATSRENALEEGFEKGIEKGIEEGKKINSIEIARNLKKLKINIEDIVKATGISKDEVENI